MKICSKCGELKKITYFHKDKKSKDGCVSMCKLCVSEKSKEYYKQNIEMVNKKAVEYRKNNKEKIKIRNSKYYDCNKKLILKKQRKYRVENLETIKEYDRKRGREKYESDPELIKKTNKKSYIKNREKRLAYSRKYKRERYDTDGNFRAIINLRNRFRQAFNVYSKVGKTKAMSEYINIEKIVNYIGNQPSCDFEIDHIIPLCVFNFNNELEVQAAFLPENHQWLLSYENRIKNKNILDDKLTHNVQLIIDDFLIKNGEKPKWGHRS